MSDAPDQGDHVEQMAEDRDPVWFAKLDPSERPKAQDLLQEIDRVLARMLKSSNSSTPRPE